MSKGILKINTLEETMSTQIKPSNIRILSKRLNNELYDNIIMNEHNFHKMILGFE